MPQTFHIKGEALLPAPFYVWGIVNVTPDSFHDGGKYDALTHAKSLWDQGASVIDIGGASSKPNACDVSAEEEWARVMPVIAGVKEFSARASYAKYPWIEDTIPCYATPLISVDTWRATVAEKALEMGVQIINDISSCSWDPKLMDVVTHYKPAYVLMHCQGRPKTMQNSPRYNDVMSELLRFFEQKMTRLVKAGLPEQNILVDLGIGFGKSKEHNLLLLQNIPRFKALGRPLLLGVSYKSFFGQLLGIEEIDRAYITQVCTILTTQMGILHHRVHDVEKTIKSLTLQYLLADARSDATIQ